MEPFFPIPRRAAAAALFFAFAVAMLATACRTTRLSYFDDQLRDLIRAGLQMEDRSAVFRPEEDDLLASQSIAEFYRRRDYRPAWSRGGTALPPAEELLAAIKGARSEGLNPSDYHVRVLEELVAAAQAAPMVGMAEHWISAPALARLELLLTDAYFLLASHLADGKVEQDAREARWDGLSRREDLSALLERGLSAGGISGLLGALPPQHAYYAGLKNALRRYQSIAAGGGWPTIPAGAILQPGIKDRRVERLRERLSLEGLKIEDKASAPDVMDPALAASVCAFQQRHSLPQTGVVDEATRAALNVPAADRARQIALNLERWRWLPSDFGLSHVVVDVSNFELFVVERGLEIMRMKIVVGTTAWPTPCFAGPMTDFVINPSWLAPQSVLVKELVNYMKADPNYLKSNKMFLFRGWGEEEFLLDPASLDLTAVTPANLDFHLVQMPGPLNVLGRFKFSHPNRYDIYLHDTPYQSDFGQAVRTFSHGCIRIARPVDFALYMLGGGAWTAGRLQSMVENEEEAMILLKKRVNVIVFSGTAWPLDDGSVHFRPDIYIADDGLAAALDEKPHAPIGTDIESSRPKKTPAKSPADSK
jgi:L,D-transpeptidase YcbB